jgi:hypothetical protein
VKLKMVIHESLTPAVDAPALDQTRQSSTSLTYPPSTAHSLFISR